MYKAILTGPGLGIPQLRFPPGCLFVSYFPLLRKAQSLVIKLNLLSEHFPSLSIIVS